MALDAVFFRHLIKEIGEATIGSKIDKIFQPTKDELTLVFRSLGGTVKLLISANASSARLYLTSRPTPNPKSPPMFCMLLRKRLIGAKLVCIDVPELERVAFFVFETYNELGDKVELKLVAEIMGKYSNIILLDQDGAVIDAIKRVDINVSSKRPILPKLKYNLPEKQDKISLVSSSALQVISKMESLAKEETLSKALSSCILGISPIIARELEYRCAADNLTNKTMNSAGAATLLRELEDLSLIISGCKGIPFLVTATGGKPLDVSFMEIGQYGTGAKSVEKSSFSSALDEFYYERALIERIKSKTQSLHKVLINRRNRVARKVAAQRAELEKSKQRESLKQKGDLLQANLHLIEKGAACVKLQNFYDNMNTIEISLNPSLTPAKNAQNYYKKYHKAANAEKFLTVEIEKGMADINYLDSVLDILSRTRTDEEVSEIRQELRNEGYLKPLKASAKRNKEKKLPPLSYSISEGYTVLVGRNNRQNDNLSLRKAKPYDIWFHVKAAPGAHAILLTEGGTPPEVCLYDAACIAAFHSSYKDSSNVPVDYTKVKNVNKPRGAKPGMVIYVNYSTLYVQPRSDFDNPS